MMVCFHLYLYVKEFSFNELMRWGIAGDAHIFTFGRRGQRRDFVPQLVFDKRKLEFPSKQL
jgi:hypothetical protein